LDYKQFANLHPFQSQFLYTVCKCKKRENLVAEISQQDINHIRFSNVNKITSIGTKKRRTQLAIAIDFYNRNAPKSQKANNQINMRSFTLFQTTFSAK
ncbi:MAG: hypothetical protein II604_01570, partial [Bacteroidales bacterium]|nr:hypothetical protein [Bacteroidales bacterium]